MTKPNHVILGKVVSTHGIHGWLSILCFAHPPQNLKNYDTLMIFNNLERKINITDIKTMPKKVIIKIIYAHTSRQALLQALHQPLHQPHHQPRHTTLGILTHPTQQLCRPRARRCLHSSNRLHQLWHCTLGNLSNTKQTLPNKQ